MRFRQSTWTCVLVAFLLFLANSPIAAERFYISIPGPTLSYTHLYYGQEKGFFSQEGLDLQVLVVRGIIGISSLMAGEIDVTCHAGSGLAAALRGLPVKVISVTHDRPVHELIVAPSIKSPADLLSMDTTARLQSLLPITRLSWRFGGWSPERRSPGRRSGTAVKA
ncbi:MAG TPA: ABC transporter substrate-binding protein [Candidatus Binatia bacterium]|nr:ABC transporter substrate-binding protein [Candidatus Binatia bacterium]